MPDKELQALIDGFKKYKEHGDAQGIFGRDAQYSRPSSAAFAELQHVHTRDSSVKPHVWNNIRTAQFNKVSNSAVVYTYGASNKNCYLLIDFFELDAHQRARDTLYIASLADIAERFRERF